MSSVSQTIPNYIFGINEQPDYLKRPGQVRDSLNMTPDVTKGLIKRPGSRFVCNVEDDTDGKWFNYYRTDAEQYIGHIQANGFVRVWNSDGTVCTVTQLVTTNTVTTVDTISGADASRTAGTYTIGVTNYTTDSTAGHGATFSIVVNGSGAATVTITNGGSNYAVNDTFTIADAQLGGGGGAALTFDVATVTSPATTNTTTHGNYLTNTAAEDLQTLTVNDYTFVCNRNRTAVYNNTLSSTPPNEGIIELKVIAYGRNYTVDFHDDNGTDLFSATINTTADSTQVINSDTILNDLVSDINAQSNFTATRIGNVVHVVNSAASFTMETSDVTLLSVFTDSVNNVERLPYQCHHGYVTKIVNSNSEEDDYYAVFEGRDGQDGAGVWQETVGWIRNNDGTFTGINTTLNPTTMPHVLICTNLNTFTVAAADGATPNADLAMSYSARSVGDLGTNPNPSFVNAQINQMLLFRNRIAFLTGENVVMTTSGGLNPVNFFSTSALTSLATDPIDVSAASKEPALLWDGVEINSGLLLFAENQQYLMTTDSDLLTQETTKLNAISYYPYSRRCSPFSLGTTVAFIDNSGSNARMFEMSNISRDTEPTVIEQSKPISRLTPSTVVDISDSRESSLVLLSSANSNILFGYKYFQDGPERQLSSWFRWQLTGTVIYHCIMRDKYYTVVRYRDHNRLLVMDLQDTMDTAFVTFDGEDYQIHLDNRVTIAHADITHDGATNTSTFTMPQDAGENELDASHRDIFAYVTTANDPDVVNGSNQGRFSQVTFDGNTGSLSGDWSSQDIQLGYLFEASVTVPQFYVTRPEGNSVRANTRSNTVIHRLYLETGAIGTCHYTLDRTGKDNFTGHIDGITFDQYDANDPLLSESLRTYIPVYERNTNVVLRIHAEHPSPLSLFSISWEGDVSNRYYQSV